MTGDSERRWPARRVAAALRALTGRGPRASVLLGGQDGAQDDEAPDVAVQANDERPGVAIPADPLEVTRPQLPTSGEDAAARIDAARERLRATITVPEDPADEPGEDQRARKRGP